VLLFFVLACGVTWLLDLPLALAWATHVPPPAHAMPMVGLGAWGPTLAAFVIAAQRRELRGVFGRWRTSPIWIVTGLFVPLAVHLPATLVEVALGGHPAHWFYPPAGSEQMAALVMFSIGEEFGWRGFAYARLEQRHGPVVGSLILGAVWGLWHLGMLFTPEHGPPELLTVAFYMADLALWSVVMAWAFERGARSIAVAIAMHAGAHLDDVYRAPETEVRLRILRFVALAIVAEFAARSLTASKRAGAGLAAAPVS
jgi:uncharacterized protein